jgi:hypothetical protein
MVARGSHHGRSHATADQPGNDQQEDTMTRFTLDEGKAAEWIAANIAQSEQFYGDCSSRAPELEITADYSPATDFESGSDTVELVGSARDAGIIAGPGELLFDFLADSEGVGYAWLLYLGEPGHTLKLSSGYESLHHLGDGSESKGADAAMAVLREAVSTGNRLLDDLDAYVTSVRGPDEATEDDLTAAEVWSDYGRSSQRFRPVG